MLADSQRQDKDDFASGVVLYDTAHDGVIRRVEACNIIDTTRAYQNGDGIAGERGNHNITIEDCYTHHITDGGIDLKGDGIVVRRHLSYHCHRSYRLWGLCELHECISREPADNAGANPYAQGHFCCFEQGLLQLFNCRAEATTSKADVFHCETAGILSVDAATTWSVPAGTTIRFAESANFGDPAGIVIDRPTNGVPPVVTGPGSPLSIPENTFGKWQVTTDRPAQIRIVGGADAKEFDKLASELRLRAQDYEANPNPRQVQFKLIDGQGLWSAVQSYTVTIQDVADDPVTPSILIDDGVTRGVWLEVGPGYCWQDVEGTVPCVSGSVCKRIDDRFGFGNHALQPDDAFAATYREEAGLFYLDFDNAFYRIGAPGALAFAQLTAVMAMRRTDTETPLVSKSLVTQQRTIAPGSNNICWSMGTVGGQSLNIRARGSSISSSSGGPAPKANAVLSMRTASMKARNRAIDIADGSDVAAIAYTSPAYAILGASGNLDSFMLGRFSGLVVTNRTEQDSAGTNMLFRIERQLGVSEGLSL